MTTIAVIDPDGQVFNRLAPALGEKGWQVQQAPDAASAASADAVVVAAQPGQPAEALATVMEVRRTAALAGTPVVLVAELNRTGWDRTFDSEEAFQVDAMLDAPVDPGALVRRLDGILEARRSVEPLKHHPDFALIVARAIANEEAAEDFYNKAAARVCDDSTRSALEGLAADEREHKQILLDFKGGSRSLPSGPLTTTSLVETFGTPDLTEELGPADAFLLAARKEKLAVEFYEHWAGLYAEGPERELLLGLAEVERRHKARVEEMFCNAAFPESW